MQRALLTVNAAGLIGRLPRSAFTTTPVREATAEPIRHWVAVRQRGTLLAASPPAQNSASSGCAIIASTPSTSWSGRRPSTPT